MQGPKSGMLALAGHTHLGRPHPAPGPPPPPPPRAPPRQPLVSDPATPTVPGSCHSQSAQFPWVPELLSCRFVQQQQSRHEYAQPGEPLAYRSFGPSLSHGEKVQSASAHINLIVVSFTCGTRRPDAPTALPQLLQPPSLFCSATLCVPGSRRSIRSDVEPIAYDQDSPLARTLD